MTHTLYRRGSAKSLQEDFVLLGMCATGITHQGFAEVKKRLFELLQKFPHANSGEVKTGSEFNADMEDILAGFMDTSVIHYVFTDKETVVEVLQAVKKADLGISVVVTGLFDEVGGCCRKAGIEPHTVEHAAGIMGRVDRLPADGVLEVTTMCGHGLVAPNLVLNLLEKVKKGKLSLEEAGSTLAQPCICGIFNPKRAEKQLAALM